MLRIDENFESQRIDMKGMWECQGTIGSMAEVIKSEGKG